MVHALSGVGCEWQAAVSDWVKASRGIIFQAVFWPGAGAGVAFKFKALPI